MTATERKKGSGNSHNHLEMRDYKTSRASYFYFIVSDANFAWFPAICFANFPFFISRAHIPGTMYFTGFAVIFDCSKTAAFRLYPPNFILGENSFYFLKFPISHFSNLGDNNFPFGGIWG